MTGDRNDDDALAFAKACGEIFDGNDSAEKIAEYEKSLTDTKAELEKLKADNDKLRNDYKDLFFKGKAADPKDFGEDIRRGASEERPDNPVAIPRLAGIQYKPGTVFIK